MHRSFGLTLYNLGHRRVPQGEGLITADVQARKAGRLIWLHAPDAARARPMLELARRIAAEDRTPVLMTCPDPLPERGGVTHQPPPEDAPATVRAFLDHWCPDVAVFPDHALRPALVHAAQARGITTLLVDAGAPALLRDRSGWWPGLLRNLLVGFDHAVAADEAGARALRKAGVRADVLQTAGRLGFESAALPCTEAERVALARALASRPVWLAASLPEAEEEAVIAAHTAALHLSHRLLLIVVPEDASRVEPLAARMEAEAGWIVGRRSADQEPEGETEAYIADSVSELGLWYRLAPITFLGGSLVGAGALRDPMEAAALGSAILCGARAGMHGAAFARMTASQAMRIVGSATQLGDALGDLLSPDRAARLAQAAWAAATEGAEATETVLRLIRAARPVPG